MYPARYPRYTVRIQTVCENLRDPAYQKEGLSATPAGGERTEGTKVTEGRGATAVNDYRRHGRVRVARRAPASSSRLSEHTANVCAPPAGARRATLASQPDSLSREDNGIFPGTAGKKPLTALGEGECCLCRAGSKRAAPVFFRRCLE